MSELKINSQRLRKDLQALSQIGLRHDHGIYRMAFSKGDLAGRDWFLQQINDAGLTAHQDGAANICARLGWDDYETPNVIAGSHLDTVPGAGHLDGALGVVAALEALRVFKEQNVALTCPVEAISFTDEEGRFGGLFGSQSMAGLVTPEYLHNAIDLEGYALTTAMKDCGFNALDALHTQRRPGSIRAYVELHIEQGPVLDRKALAIGVVEAITGLIKWEITLNGTANHAGTTPMDMRKDAFQGLAEFASQIERVLSEFGSPRSVATVGTVALTPGAANVVPGQAVFSLEIRDTDQKILDDLADAFRRVLSAIARRRDLMFEFNVLSRIEPVACSPKIIDAIYESVQAADVRYTKLHSGAAHDAQIIANIAPAGMIFVPSKDGRSHSTAEWTAWEDIEAGANILLNTMRRLAG